MHMQTFATRVIGPTFEEMLHPHHIHAALRERALTAAQDEPLDPVNLYNITWRGPDGRCHFQLLPRELTGVEANIVVLHGCRFPTGSLKVGPAYAVLAEKVLSGDAIPSVHTCVWPSTGNYGIGGTWVAGCMSFESVVVMPQQMSPERFDLIRRYGGRIIVTSGSGSNVREVFQKCTELVRGAPERYRVLNQFDSMGNYRFHYYVTGNTIAELASELADVGVGKGQVDAYVSAVGSGGTIAAGDRIKQVFAAARVVGVEPIQCSTLFNNGYGHHEVQGIADRQVTWIHNVANMDAIMAIDDLECKQGLQLLAEETGWHAMIHRYGVPEPSVRRMATSFGISGVCNLLAAIKTAKFYELGRDHLIVTVATDGIDRYRSVLAQMSEEHKMDEVEAAVRLVSIFHKQKLDWIKEATTDIRRAWHNLKYYTWVAQQGKTIEELEAQQSHDYWLAEQAKVAGIDQQILERRTTVQSQAKSPLVHRPLPKRGW